MLWPKTLKIMEFLKVCVIAELKTELKLVPKKTSLRRLFLVQRRPV